MTTSNDPIAIPESILSEQLLTNSQASDMEKDRWEAAFGVEGRIDHSTSTVATWLRRLMSGLPRSYGLSGV